MAYSIHIERSYPITVDEWLTSVKETDGVRIDESDFVGTNPITEEKIRIPGSSETAALWFPELKQWIKVFWLRKGRVTFNAKDWDNPNSPIRDKAFELARKLNAEIVGDNGEIYIQSK